jgi:hypothetical protein
MIVVGVLVFLVPDSKASLHRTEDIVWGVMFVVGGIAVTAFGAIKRKAERRQSK